ncbi:MAG: DUF3575 domain-containing protein [Brumimicrobium sp.]
MSDHNERAFLKDKFKDFGAASSSATKSAVMSEINKKRRKKRFIIIFFLSVCVMVIGAITTVYYTETSITQTHEVKGENSKNKNQKISKTKHASNKTDFVNDKNQPNSNKNNVLSYKKIDNKETQFSSTQIKSKSFQSKNETVNKGVQEQQEVSNTISEKDSLLGITPENKPSKNKNENLGKVTIPTIKIQNDEVDKKNLINDSKINKLTIKSLTFPQSTKYQYELEHYESSLSLDKDNKWIVGLTYSYMDLRLGQPEGQPVTADVQSPSLYNPPNEFLPSQKIQRVKNSMNLELSVIRKFKNKFFLQSGIRYTNLNSVTTSHQMKDHLLGVPLKVGYNIPLKERWALDFSTGVNYNISIARSEKNIEPKSKNTFNNFSNFQMSTAEFNVGVSYFMNDRVSFKLSPQLSYLMFYKEKVHFRYFQKQLWLGGQFGCYFHLN